MHPEFQLNKELIYLNHAAVSPWPLRTVQAVESFARENLTQGTLGYPEWLKVEARLRQLLKGLINAPSVDDISLMKSTSEALSVVAYGIDWNAGENIVIFAQEFPSNRIVWQSLKSLGVDTRLVDLEAGENPEAALLAACDSNTRLISTSSVQYARGQRIDLSRIGEYCKAQDILFCIDAIQSLGALPFDVQQYQADFVMADGHKWMLGPEGLALLYTKAETREALKLRQYGWHMVENPGNFEQTSWKPVQSGVRFECGSPNMLSIHALKASLELIMEEGIDRISSAILDKNRYLREQIVSTDGLKLLSPLDDARSAGIITFQAVGADQQQLYTHLMQKKVVCALRGGGIRLSPHFYTPIDQLDEVMSILRGNSHAKAHCQ